MLGSHSCKLGHPVQPFKGTEDKCGDRSPTHKTGTCEEQRCWQSKDRELCAPLLPLGICPSSSNAALNIAGHTGRESGATLLWAELMKGQSRGSCAEGSALPSSS